MQTLEIEKKICQAHKLEIVAVDLKSQTRKDEQYFCTKCLSDKVDKQNMVLINEAAGMIQCLKNSSYKAAMEESAVRLTNFNQLKSSIKAFKNYINTEIEKLLQLVDQQIEYIQIEMESKEIVLEMQNFDEEIQTLSKNYLGNSRFNIIIEKTFKDKDLAVIKIIQDSIEAQQKSQYFSSIIESIDLIKSTMRTNQQINMNTTPAKQFDEQKTPCLNKICNKHNKEIIMLNFNQSQLQSSRLACVECIEENPIQYISLKEANKRWHQQIEQSQDSISKYISRRTSTFKIAIEEIQQLRNYQNNSLSELLISIEDQLIKNDSDLSDLLKLENKQIFELNNQEIEKMIDLLSQKDLDKNIIENQEKLDFQFYQKVKQKMDSLIKHDLMCKLELLKVLGVQQNAQEEQLQNSDDMKANHEINDFLSKCQLQEQYLQIFNESVDLQLELEKKVEKLKENGQLEQCIERRNVENNDAISTSLIYQNLKQYEINSKKMSKLIIAEETEKKLKLITKQRDELQLKIEQEKNEISSIKQQFNEQFNDQTINVNKQLEYLTQTLQEKHILFNQQNLLLRQEVLSKIQDEKQVTHELFKQQNFKVEQFIIENERKLNNQEQQKQYLAQSFHDLQNKKAQLEQELTELNNKIDGNRNYINKLDLEVQENVKFSIQHEELLKNLFGQVHFELLSKDPSTFQFFQKLFYQQKLDQVVKPILLNQDFWIRLFFVLQEKSKKKINTLQQINLEGRNNTSFWKACNDKNNLLMIFKSQSGYIFGGFTPLQWKKSNGSQYDNSYSSFLFSQTHNEIYPMRYEKSQTIYCHEHLGPIFGGGDDLKLEGNFQNGYSKLGESFQWDQYENKKSSHLFGQDTPNVVECEIYQLKFI